MTVDICSFENPAAVIVVNDHPHQFPRGESIFNFVAFNASQKHYLLTRLPRHHQHKPAKHGKHQQQQKGGELLVPQAVCRPLVHPPPPSLPLPDQKQLSMAHFRQRQTLCLALYRHCSFQKQKPVPSASSVPSSPRSNLLLTALPTPPPLPLLLPSTCCFLPLLMKNPRPPSSFCLNSNAGTSCVSAFIRRLLCSSLSDNVAGDNAVQKKPQPVSPSVVARIMGLDSMPVFPCSSPESGRSLCEAPVFLRQENENFLVLSFVPEEKVERIGRKCKLKKRKEEFSGGEETRNNLKNSELGKENSPEKEHSSSKPCGIDSYNNTKNMPCCCHQDLSPVSVLDYPFLIRYTNSLDSEEEEVSEFQNPRRLSSKFENLNFTTSGFHLQLISSSRGPPTAPEPTSNSKPVAQDHSRNWLRIIELTEEEVKLSAWISNLNRVWRSEENREIAAEIAKKVLDLLLEETVYAITNSIFRSCS